MALFNIFKKNEEKQKIRAEKKEVERNKDKQEQRKNEIKGKQEIKEKPRSHKTLKGKRIDLAAKSLEQPHITEKATALAEENQYVFKVKTESNKSEIKKAVEGLYGVDVINVRIINVSPRKKRLGRIEGIKKGYKKAYIKIKEGQKIEVLPK